MRNPWVSDMNETTQMGVVGHDEVESLILNQSNKKDLDIIDEIEDPRIILNELRRKNRGKIIISTKSVFNGRQFKHFSS